MTLLESQELRPPRHHPSVSHRVVCFDSADRIVLDTPARGRPSTIGGDAYRLAEFIGCVGYYLRSLKTDEVFGRHLVR